MKKRYEESPEELEAIVERLRNGDLSAMAKVNRRNVDDLITRAMGDKEVEQMLRDWR